MKKTAIITGALLTAIFTSSAVMADTRHNAPSASSGHHSTASHDYRRPAPAPMYVGVDTSRLERRIAEGARSGKLTRNEERQLRSELRSLEASIKAAKRDFRISSWERSSLKRKETLLSSHITKLTNNRTVERRHDNRRDDRHDNNHNDNNRHDSRR